MKTYQALRNVGGFLGFYGVTVLILAPLAGIFLIIGGEIAAGILTIIIGLPSGAFLLGIGEVFILLTDMARTMQNNPPEPIRRLPPQLEK